jgi:hypothetical protein
MKKSHITMLTIFLAMAVLLVVAWLALPSSFFFGGESPAEPSGRYAVWEIDARCFKLEVADTPQLRRQGLSGRADLAADRGMLFTYNLRGEYGFWMRGMNFPLDIIWLDGDDEVVTIKSSVSADSYPEVFYPDDYAKKIIEVSAGSANELGVKPGDLLNVSAATTTPPVDCRVL